MNCPWFPNRFTASNFSVLQTQRATASRFWHVCHRDTEKIDVTEHISHLPSPRSLTFSSRHFLRPQDSLRSRVFRGFQIPNDRTKGTPIPAGSCLAFHASRTGRPRFRRPCPPSRSTFSAPEGSRLGLVLSHHNLLAGSGSVVHKPRLLNRSH